jgi:hypothetical protein
MNPPRRPNLRALMALAGGTPVATCSTFALPLRDLAVDSSMRQAVSLAAGL